MSIRITAIALVGLMLLLGLSAAYSQSGTGAKKSVGRTGGWKTDFRKASVPFSEIIPGGPPKDGIPAIDNPRFVSIKKASRWIAEKEPVVVVTIDGETKGYPLQILIWHEIVNDVVGKTPVTVTFCPLCYSAIVFDRRVNGITDTFGVSGLLRKSDMIMYDRHTESWWQQFSGEAIVGTLTGKRLEKIPSQIVSFGQLSEAFPKAKVLSRNTGYKRTYGRNPYVGYDDIDKTPFLFKGARDGRLRPMEKVVAVTIGSVTRAYPYSITRKMRAINDKIKGTNVVVFHADGAVSALDRGRIAKSRLAGSTGVFDPTVDGKKLSFEYRDGKFYDSETKSRWNIFGNAVAGDYKGKSLRPFEHGDYFAFAWLAFNPETEIYR